MAGGGGGWAGEGELDLHQLVCFLQLAQDRHVGRAADALGLDPVWLEQTVRLLEDDLDLHLVDWRRRPLELTGAGTRLVGPARLVVRGADRWWGRVGQHRRPGGGCGRPC